jgi:hypothetical protein
MIERHEGAFGTRHSRPLTYSSATPLTVGLHRLGARRPSSAVYSE